MSGFWTDRGLLSPALDEPEPVIARPAWQDLYAARLRALELACQFPTKPEATIQRALDFYAFLTADPAPKDEPDDE